MSDTSCPTCGSDKREVRGWRVPGHDNRWRVRDASVSCKPVEVCQDPWHDTPEPAGYDWRADLDRLYEPLCRCEPDTTCATCEAANRLAAEFERLARNISALTHNADDDKEAYLKEVKAVVEAEADRDKHKAEAERWERVARVLADNVPDCVLANYPDCGIECGMDVRKAWAAVKGERELTECRDCRLAWAEKEADK